MLNLLSTFGAASSFFLAFLVFSVRRDTNVMANRWLALFLLILSIFLIDGSLVIFKIDEAYPLVGGWLSLSIFALAPILYLSVSYFVSLDRRFRRLDILHFIPAIVFSMLSLPSLLGSADVQNLDQQNPREKSIYDLVLMLFLIGQSLIYWWFSYRKLQKHHKNIEDISSAPETVNLDWLQYFLLGIFVMIAVWLAEIIFIPYQGGSATWATPLYLAAIYFLGYHVLRQQEVFPFTAQTTQEIFEILEENNAPADKPSKQYFSAAQCETLTQSLTILMETQKPYLDNELSLPSLARQARLTPHELSHLINECFGENFAQFVNRFRVAESKALLLSKKYAHLTMVGIAYEAGFNSKTAFNTAFKKITGVSPTAFQREAAVGGTSVDT